MEISEIIEKLDYLRVFEEGVQLLLREYVLDKSVPLEERYAVWEKYCNKEHYISIYDDIEYIKNQVDENIDSFDRNSIYDYEFFQSRLAYEIIDELGYNVDVSEIDADPRMIYLKGEFIEKNFGSFIFG